MTGRDQPDQRAPRSRPRGALLAGCAVALVEAARVAAFIDAVTARYRRVTGHTPIAYVCRATDGAGICKAGSGQ